MSNNALVIVWNGDTLSDYMTERIGQFLLANGICKPENLTIKFLDEGAIANALLRDSTKIVFDTTGHGVSAETVNVKEALESAIIYISEKFARELNHETGGIVQFTLSLSSAIVAGDLRLRNAVEIISTTTQPIPRSLAKRYNFPQYAVGAIKQIYERIK